MGTAHLTCGCWAKCSKLLQRILLVALPMRNTEYSNKFTEPERAPTIKSVELIVLAKLAQVSVRTLSTARSKVMDREIAKMVSKAVKRRLFKLRKAIRSKCTLKLLLAGGTVELIEVEAAIK